MCFAPQRRALFPHLNCQKWSGPGVFCTFGLGHVLRATTACTFWTSQLPKVVREWCTFSLRNVLRATTACRFSTSQLVKMVRPWCALYILTCKCASRHNGVQFFISHLASWLRTRRFSEPTFRPSGAPNHWKNTVFRDFPTFSRICIFFHLTLLSSNLSLLSASSLLCFSSVHIVGSLTSKLPSIMYLYIYRNWINQHINTCRKCNTWHFAAEPFVRFNTAPSRASWTWWWWRCRSPSEQSELCSYGGCSNGGLRKWQHT